MFEINKIFVWSPIHKKRWKQLFYGVHSDNNFTCYAILKGLQPQIRCYVLQNNVRTVDEVSRLGRVAEKTVTNDISLLWKLQKDKNVAQLEVEFRKLASMVQKLAIGNISGTGAPKPRPPHGRHPQPQSRRPPFQTQQSSSWTRQPMAQVQDPPIESLIGPIASFFSCFDKCKKLNYRFWSAIWK